MKNNKKNLIKENDCDLIALTFNGEPVKYTDLDSEVKSWIKNGNEYDWYPVNN